MLLKCNFNIPISVHVFYLLAMGCFLEYLGRVARQGTWHCKWKTLGQVSQQSSSPPLRHTAHQSSFELFSSIPLSPLVASSCCCYRLDVQISQVVHDIKKRSENLWYSHDGWLLSLNKQSIISKMIFNKVNHHKLIGHFFLVSGYIFKCRLTWLVSASFELRFSMFAFAYQVVVCVFKQLALLGFESLAFWGFLAMVVCVPPPHPPSFFPPLIYLVLTGAWNGGLMAGLQGFASHGSSILSRCWLATVEAPGYPRLPPST